MPKLKSFWDMSQYLLGKGYDIFPFKTEKGNYKVTLWRNDSFIDFGKFEYKEWEEAVFETTKAIYNKINQTQ